MMNEEALKGRENTLIEANSHAVKRLGLDLPVVHTPPLTIILALALTLHKTLQLKSESAAGGWGTR
jgi:hypothetical protein